MIELVKKEPKLELTAALGAGYEKGFNEGYTKGKDEGSAFYNDYWDTIQQNGELTDYADRFQGADWNDNTFLPKHNAEPESAYEMFWVSQITDINSCLEKAKVKFDFSTGKCTNYTAFMSRSVSVSCPSPLNIENAVGKIGSLFYNAQKVKKVHLTGVKEEHDWTYVFTNNYDLTDLIIDGVIGTAFTIQASSLLTNESAQSVINALKDLTGETALNVRFHVKVKNNLTADQWQAAGSKNWNII